jgi:two-component system chemotaxis response regulator CheB
VIDPPAPAPDRPRGQTVVVAGASAGGVEALIKLVGSLPRDFPHGVVVVLHVAPTGTSVLPEILARAGSLPVVAPRDGEELAPGHVYVAPPDTHLILEGSVIRLSKAPRENGHRPAIDPSMRSAAIAYGSGAIGVVLSGSRDDGTAGLMAIKANGGIAIVQDPEEALYRAMPTSAMTAVKVDAVLPVASMAGWILERARRDGGPTEVNRPAQQTPADPPARDIPTAEGEGTRFTCPDCGGVLFEHHEGPLERFQCSVGHVFSIESLSSGQADALENALWAAVRALEDRATLLRRMAQRSREAGRDRGASGFETKADDALRRAQTIRAAIQPATIEGEKVAEA